MSLQSWITRMVSVDLWKADLSTVSVATRLQVHCLRFFVVVTEEVSRDQLTLRAMGLVYVSLLSLVPFLAVTFSVLKAFGVHQSLEPVLLNALQPLGSQGVELTQYIITSVNNLEVGVLGAVGVAGLFFTVISLLGQIEDALNQIWRARESRTLARKFTDYLSVILVGPVLVFSAFALTASAQSHWLLRWLLQKFALEWVLVAVTRVTPFFFLCVAFTFFYKFLPRARIHFSSAVVGGAAAALLWQITGIGFSLFIANSARYTAIYSGFAVVILSLIWLYVGWLVVLVGGEIAYLYQHGLAALARDLRGQRHGAARLRLTLQVFVVIARRALTRQPPWDESSLARQIGATSLELEELLKTAIRHGLLLRTAEPEGVGLARLPEHITVYDIYSLVEPPDHEAPAALDQEDNAIGDILRCQHSAVEKAFSHLTLRALLADMEPASSAVHTPQNS